MTQPLVRTEVWLSKLALAEVVVADAGAVGPTRPGPADSAASVGTVGEGAASRGGAGGASAAVGRLMRFEDESPAGDGSRENRLEASELSRALFRVPMPTTGGKP
jgi:hypothetical protein